MYITAIMPMPIANAIPAIENNFINGMTGAIIC